MRGNERLAPHLLEICQFDKVRHIAVLDVSIGGRVCHSVPLTSPRCASINGCVTKQSTLVTISSPLFVTVGVQWRIKLLSVMCSQRLRVVLSLFKIIHSECLHASM